MTTGYKTAVVKVEFHDDGEHIWIDGKQYVSLKRFIDLKQTQLKEMQLLQEKASELTKENNAFRDTIKALTK